MSVSIEDVLALLPELFPVEQQISLTNIRPNPKNPGRRLTPSEIQVLADNIAQRGLVNAIKVRPDRDNPLAPGVQLHPDNPRLRSDGQPWALEDFNWEILAGENRYRAFDLLKRPKIPGFILNPSPQEANEIMWLDNDVRERGWWAAYQAIEMEIEANPNLTMQEVADNLKMDKDKVSRALRLLPLLGPKTRDLILGVSESKNNGILDLGEMATARLGDLGPYPPYKPGSWQKARAQGQEPPKLWPYPPVPPQTQDLVHQAMFVAGDQEMSESQVKGLVAHIKSGGDPEQYRPGMAPPKTRISKGLGQPVPKTQPEAAVSEGIEDSQPPAPTPTSTQTQPVKVAPEVPKGEGNNTFLAGLTEVFQGFSAAAIKDALGKLPENKWQAVGYILEKGIKALRHLVGRLIKFLGSHIGKAIHGIAEAGANQFVPLGSRSGGKSSSYRSHLSQTPFKALGHGVAYLFITLFCYSTLLSTIGSFTPFIGPWVQTHVIQLVHWLWSLLLGACGSTLQKPLWFFGACVILLTWIHKTFKPGFWPMAFLAVLLLVTWHFKGWVMGELNISIPEETSISPPQKTSTISIPQVANPAPPKEVEQVVAQAKKPKTRAVAHSGSTLASRFQTERRGLVVPDQEKGAGTPNPALSPSKGSSLQTPNFISVRPWSPAEEPLESFQDELALIPQPCLIKEFPMTPDTEMGADMATHRINDLQDEERYSTFIGRDRHRVVSATPNPAGLTLSFQGGLDLGALSGVLSGGLVGGASNNGLEIYWEDLKGIHCNKIQTLSDNLKAIYQCSLMVPGMKKPLIVQCSSADDCERLVSALQFWVRTARKGTNAPMSGLPYPNQGVLLGDGNQVNVTWADSPIDKSGLINGDHIWGVDQNPAKQPGKDETQTALQNLSSGNHTLYAINPGEWEKAHRYTDPRKGTPYHAKLEKVGLSVP